MDRNALLNAIASRNAQSDIGIAGNDLRALQACLNGTGPCSPEMFGAKSWDDLERMLKDADHKFTYSSNDTVIGDLATKGQALSPGSILDFDCIVTSSSMDRDKDVLKSSGARLDPAAPVLLYHNPELPVGRLVSKIAQNDRLLSARCCILNTTLGRDAAVLIEGGAVRISHGFDPTEYEPLKGGRYLISSFDIYEISLVPIPSNPTAVITAFSRGKLHHPFVKSFAKRMFDERTAMVQGVTFEAKPCGCSDTHDCGCGGKGHKDTYRHQGESLQDCVSRKIAILVGEGKSQEQAAAEAYSMCGEKALAELRTREENSMSTPAPEATPVTTKAPETQTPRTPEHDDRVRGQGPQQGDHDWHQRRMPNEVQDENLPGVDDFDVGNTAQNSVMTLLTGSNAASQVNAAPDTALANNPGTTTEPGVPSPTLGVPQPMPTNPNNLLRSNSPVAKDVNDASNVQPLNSDSASHHNTAPLDTHVNVDIPGLKHMARMVKHSGQEGAMYLNPDSGHVHHVMHPDDMHYGNSHKYHTPHEIAKMYGSVHGVTGVKTAVSFHPSKGAGYKMLHKGGPDTSAEAETGDMVTAASITSLKEIRNHLLLAFRAPDSMLAPEVKLHISAAGKALDALLKWSSTNPNNDPAPAKLPDENSSSPQNTNRLTGTPSPNVVNKPSADHLTGVPADNQFQPQTGDNFGDESVGGTGGKTSPAMYAASDGSIAIDTVSHDPVMKWLETEDSLSDEDAEFQAMLAEQMFDEIGV